MVVKNENSNGVGKPSSPAKNKHPTIGQCRKVAGGSPTRGEVLLKLWHYCSNPRYEIDGAMYSAPTTDRLREELGLGRSTIQKRIKELRELGFIEVVNKRFRRSDRRYVRILIDPRKADEKIEETEIGFMVSNVDGEPTKKETVTSSTAETVQYKKKNKKKYEKKEASSQEVACTAVNSTNSGGFAADPTYARSWGGIQIRPRTSGENGSDHITPSKAADRIALPASPRKPKEPLSLSKGLADKEAQIAALSFANRIVIHLRNKHGMDNTSLNIWYDRSLARHLREYARKTGK